MVNTVELLLARHADTAWRATVRPWLEARRGRLERAFVIVATRGQAHGLKQRCLEERVPLLGVEFLTPGLARKKWLALARAPVTAMGRELLLLGLRTLVARRLVPSPVEGLVPGPAEGLAPLRPEDPAWGFWKSLQSDPGRALDDFDELLQAGFAAGDFPLPPLRDVFVELAAWVAARGYTLAAVEAKRAGAEPLAPDAPALGGRVLVYGLGPETWGEFFNVAAFVRRCSDVTVVLPEPEFRGRAGLDERWVELWSRLLGADALPIDAPEPAESCEPVGALWSGEGGAGLSPHTGETAGEGARPPLARLLVGRTRGDEMQLVAGEIAALLRRGAENIAVIFPRADAAHLQLARLLAGRGVPFCDLLETAGPPPIDVQAQHALLAFYTRGARLEELLALWPLLRATGAATLPLADARRACERSFDACQVHTVAAQVAAWADRAPELARVAKILLPAWPDELPLAAALKIFRAVCDRLGLAAPEGWGALDAFAARDPEPFPLAVVTATLASFLPGKDRVEEAPGLPVPARQTGRGGFARVTLTTRRRAEGLAWSHVLFVESNAGVWPERREPGCWLTDEQRRGLSEARLGAPGLFTADDRAGLERAGCAAVARDTRGQVIFSAALFAEEEPELKLAPNSWVERVIWAQNLAGADGDLEAAFERAAIAVAPRAPADADALEAWHAVWTGRRDAHRPFDEFFCAGDPARITPARLPAKLIERGVRDPAELWFEAVLGLRRTAWEPLARARRKTLGQRAHDVLAAALQPAEGPGRGFGEMPARAEAAARLAAALADARREWPADRYWDSFHAELAQLCTALLENVLAIEGGRFVATEAWLPAEAHLVLGTRRLPVVGRLDLVRLDRPEWRGAHVDIVDFKTGGDAGFSAARMARSGASLQLGVYLAAARSLGAAGGRVWMIKPEPGAVAALTFAELDVALAKLGWLAAALDRGVYGALTRDRSDYAPDGFTWPLACAPVPAAVLDQKFALTFGAGGEACLRRLPVRVRTQTGPGRQAAADE
ncbi:MAG: PD-(D/E)XK nuclease family protein [Verrucomicrobia bacterium]|nr:PD-(D/E)XK nuclease family protein [Verrucomicrobiota bacterium]